LTKVASALTQSKRHQGNKTNKKGSGYSGWSRFPPEDTSKNKNAADSQSFRTNERAEASNATPPKTTSLVCVDVGAVGMGVDTRVLVLETEVAVCNPGLTYLFGAVL
jgi:hypothetical protein